MLKSDLVMDVIEAEGISIPELDLMLSRAAITSLRGANRRYHTWLFYVNSQMNIVERMFKQDERHAHVTVWKEHTGCNGWGCEFCGWSGQVPA